MTNTGHYGSYRRDWHLRDGYKDPFKYTTSQTLKRVKEELKNLKSLVLN